MVYYKLTERGKPHSSFHPWSFLRPLLKPLKKENTLPQGRVFFIIT